MENAERLLSDFRYLVRVSETRLIDNIDTLSDVWNGCLSTVYHNFSLQAGELLSEVNCLKGTNFKILEFDKIEEWHNAYISDKEAHIKDGHNFNIFDLLKKEFDFHIKETMHSKLLKFLLNPNETHGQGDVFLLEFLTMIGIESPTKGRWQVTAESERIDLLIQRNEPLSVIVIENKSNWAGDQQNQLYRYWYRAIFLKTNEISYDFYRKNSHKYQILYLAPNINKLCSNQSLEKPDNDPDNIYSGLPPKVPMDINTLTFDNDIQQWLGKCESRIPNTNHRVREYINQYKMLCKTL